METGMDDYPTMVSTSNEEMGQTVVMRWEDPFHSLLSQNNQNQEDGGNNAKNPPCVGGLSLTVVSRGSFTKANYRNLPYWTRY
jgi:hypothetical protein